MLSFLLVIVSGWVHRHQLLVIEFLQAENQLLKERLRGSESGSQTRLLARKGNAVGRKALLELDTVAFLPIRCCGIGSSWRKNGSSRIGADPAGQGSCGRSLS
jgi:hypothetical protein